MFHNKAYDGKRNNIVGIKVAALRKEQRISQRQLSDNLNELGLIIDKNAVQRIESGERFVTDVELAKIAECFSLRLIDLYDDESRERLNAK